MFDFIKNNTIYSDMYRTDSEAVIVACYFNPQRSSYRSKAFRIFYDSIKHLNHCIVECVIGDALPELPETSSISRIYTASTLWHKESLLNNIIAKLPAKFKYVFWVDADVIFTNLNWLVDGVKQLQTCNIIQPFEFCVHLEKDELRPRFNMDPYQYSYLPNESNPKVWRSFCNNYVATNLWKDENYNAHGHVGFAWGARRELLDKVPLYDKALIGGADHIIAHAAAGQINHKCITKSFTDDIDDVNKWSRKFAIAVDGKIGYVSGNLYHIWHGDLEKRQYLKRIQDFTKKSKDITDKDDNGLYIGNEEHTAYMKKYMKHREVPCDDVHDAILDDTIDNVVIGYGMFGQLSAGNMMVDILNTDDQVMDQGINDNVEFGGGEFGGAGAGGTWDDNNDNGSDTVSNDSSNENFS
jgi:hypothetical protein